MHVYENDFERQPSKREPAQVIGGADRVPTWVPALGELHELYCKSQTNIGDTEQQHGAEVLIAPNDPVEKPET